MSAKPQRRKPRRTSRPLRKLWGFECSAARSRRRYYQRAVTAVVSMLAVGRAASRFMMALLASHEVSAAHDTVVRYRNLAMESGRRRDHHAAARNGGGPRIDCPRAKASTTRIAAPQCGQTKVGGTIVVEARLHDGASTAAVTFSSSRACARCSRRPALASKP